jgi:hypothetical protein
MVNAEIQIEVDLIADICTVDRSHYNLKQVTESSKVATELFHKEPFWATVDTNQAL